jgi:hypothetical protein
MLASDCLVAALLLTSPPELTVPEPALAWAEACRGSLVALALDAQLLDVREPIDYFTRRQEFALDLKALQVRFHDFAFAPLVEESQRFPDRRTINDLLDFNRAYHADLQTRLEADPLRAVHLRQALEETDQLHQIWCAARDAGCGYYYVTVRRQALRQLRDLIGDVAFYSGHMPPYVPVWRLPVER